MGPARSDNPVLDALLTGAHRLHPQTMDLSLGRIERVLARLGDPQLKLPPVFHVAGTNGKGSTVAFLRACLEASGRRVHVYTSPHLVRFNERVRIAGHLATDEQLIALLRDVLTANGGQPLTFFEATTAAAFLGFAREPADACVIEVGLGGRLDATNVVPRPVACGITQLALDHQQWLGETILDIAREKAGIAKRGVPLVLSRYPKTVTQRITEAAGLAGAKLVLRGLDWDAAPYEDQLHYKDGFGKVAVPLPRLPGAHQLDNAALAVAMLRHQHAVPVPESSLRAGMGWAEWPARMQKLGPGPLRDLLPAGAELWVDGGHNPAAGRAIADAFRGHPLAERPFYLIVGMLGTKDAGGFLKPFAGRATALYAVPVAGHASHPAEAIAATAKAAAGLPAVASASLAQAVAAIGRGSDRSRPPVVLVTGSLHLAGEALAANRQVPG